MNNPVKTDDLINYLVAGLKPVRRVPPLKMRLLCWLFAAVVTLGGAMIFVGTRSDLLSQLVSIKFSLPAIAIMALAFFSAVSACFLSVPGNEDSRVLPILASISLGAWVAVLGVGLITSDSTSLHAGEGLCCMRTVLIFSLPVALVLAYLVHRAAPIRLGMVGLSVAFAGAGMGALSSYLTCANDNSLHIFTWHFLPFLGVGCLGIFLGRLFDWQRGIQGGVNFK